MIAFFIWFRWTMHWHQSFSDDTQIQHTAEISYRRYCDFGQQLVSRRSYTNSPRSAHTTDRSVGSRQHISTFEQSEVDIEIVIAITQLHSGSDKPLWLSWRTKETFFESRSILRGKKYVDHLPLSGTHNNRIRKMDRQEWQSQGEGRLCCVTFVVTICCE